MWKYDGKKLYNSSGWIGDFCADCEEDSDNDQFVDNNYPLLKEGNPSNIIYPVLLIYTGYLIYDM